MSAAAATLLRKTNAALGAMNHTELESLSREAASLTAAGTGTPSDQLELRALRQTLQELLQTTSSNLRVLARLRSTRITRFGGHDDFSEGVQWVR